MYGGPPDIAVAAWTGSSLAGVTLGKLLGVGLRGGVHPGLQGPDGVLQ